MAAVARIVTADVAAVRLNSVDADKQQGATIIVRVPTGGLTVFVGGTGVTTTAGYPLNAGEVLPITLATPDAVWVISTGPQPVNVLELGV